MSLAHPRGAFSAAATSPARPTWTSGSWAATPSPVPSAADAAPCPPHPLGHQAAGRSRPARCLSPPPRRRPAQPGRQAVGLPCPARVFPPSLPPHGTSNSQENQRQGSSIRGLLFVARGVGVVIEGVRLFVGLIVRLGRRGVGVVGLLSEVLEAAGHELGPPAVRWAFFAAAAPPPRPAWTTGSWAATPSPVPSAPVLPPPRPAWASDNRATTPISVSWDATPR